MDNKTKNEIYQYLLQLDKGQGSDDFLASCNAGNIAQKLGISRNLASQYLNEMYYEGILIKIASRPTIFLIKDEFEKLWGGGSPLAQDYGSIEEFLRERTERNKEDAVFLALAGHNGSLGYEIEQIKAAMNYPGNGLPVLLNGATGTGKSYMAQLMYQYCVEKKLIQGKLVTVNCAEYASNAELFLTNLFGYRKGSYTGADKDNSGILAEADGGMLFFDEIHSLTPECQEKLFLFMDQGIYHMVGDNKKWYTSNVRFVFATTENPDKALLKTLIRRIPIVIHIPTLKERPISEKRSLVAKLLQEETRKFKKDVRISDLAYQQLLSYEFKGNIGELRNTLKISIASAYLKSNESDHTIDLHLNDLPAAVVKNQTDHVYLMNENRTMLNLKNLEQTNSQDSYYRQLFKSVIQYLQQFKSGKIDEETFFICIDIKLDQYVNFLYYDENRIVSAQEEIVGSVLSNMNRVFFKKHNARELSNNELHILTRYLIDVMANGTVSAYDIKKYEADIISMREIAENHSVLDYEVAKQFSQSVKNNLNIPLTSFEELVLFFFLHYFHKEMESFKIPVIILAHGYNIASGIAELANQLLHCKVFSAIDMPIESHFDTMTAKLKEYISRIHHASEVIVMVDMGSLEEFHNYIEEFTNLDVGIINNVTTKLALDVGSMIMNDYPMQKILEEAKRRSEPNYVIVKRRSRRKAILTVCASGYGVACKFASLLESSLPKKLEMDIIPAALEDLSAEGEANVLNKYDVQLMIGTLESKHQDIPFLSIEDIIAGNSAVLNETLSLYLNEEEQKEFNQNIVKNFSLDNLLDHLTILNPEKIMGHVEEIVNEMQERIHEEFSNSLIIGLYLHISCMIERLILSKHLYYSQGASDFEETHTHFIELIKEICAPVCEVYNVEVPIEEIEYIHDYIFNEESVEEKKRSVEKDKKKLDSLMEEIGFE